MVTGSHIPDDRNGIKFNRPAGEILKEDEAGIRAQTPRCPTLFDAAGALRAPGDLPPVDAAARAAYVARYLDFLPAGCLPGRRIAVYEHSSVAREILVEVLAGLGAEVLRLGRSERFIPVDTEAVRPEDEALARAWAREHGFFAICSADGDGDRPLVGDERGEFLRGDVAGILTAGWLRRGHGRDAGVQQHGGGALRLVRAGRAHPHRLPLRDRRDAGRARRAGWSATRPTAGF